MTEPLNIAVITGSTRPGRRSEGVARWVLERAQDYDAGFELIDLAEQDLPVFDEPLPPAYGQYEQPHTRRWSETIARFDAFVFITPEYCRAQLDAENAAFLADGSLQGHRGPPTVRCRTYTE